MGNMTSVRPGRPPSTKQEEWLPREMFKLSCAVMGPSGAGKSTEACTDRVEDVTIDLEEFTFEGHGLILVDTPGFDVPRKHGITDIDILKQISRWLAKCYRNPSMTLAGIIYVHDITDDRLDSTALRNLSLFHEICGSDAFSQVTILTSKWQQLGEAVRGPAEDRETELLSNPQWKSMTQHGAEVNSLRSAESNAARDVVISLLSRPQAREYRMKLKIQVELIDQNRTLPQTGAGRQLKSILKNTAKRENNNPVLRQALAQFRTPFSVRWKQFLGIYRFNEDEAFGKETVVRSSPSPNA
ncbi:hypothetical protein CC1G_08604 [Coprinopsis cinerea okayama7|uniref:G domain-containing protein n=1 Tax=Coprinopsis cinerea (strain Okayama-7 / 130 / ATCC MYA-4618 / FGSC 9003) TaxID=240176 RepID=A8NCX7_COPC7|nr:hypothetical protein CC1G_08604 [Coprinopsis cinerea okayama7\|eukprot:XP_001832654.2 hypothetical protein CC1G_08604 [Coprinopsis cinerea okayama7\